MRFRYFTTFTIFISLLSCSTNTKSRDPASINSFLKSCVTSISTIFKVKRKNISLRGFDDYYGPELLGNRLYRLMNNSWRRYESDFDVEKLRAAMVDSYYKNEFINYEGFVKSNFRVFIVDKKVVINIPYVSIGNTSLGELSDGLNLRFNKFLSVVFRAIASFKEIDPNIESFEINGVSVQNPYLARNLNSYGFMIKGYDKALPDDDNFIKMYKRLVDETEEEQLVDESGNAVDSDSVSRSPVDDELINQVLESSDWDLSFYREFRFR